jgi:hypothetical protein
MFAIESPALMSLARLALYHSGRSGPERPASACRRGRGGLGSGESWRQSLQLKMIVQQWVAWNRVARVALDCPESPATLA